MQLSYCASILYVPCTLVLLLILCVPYTNAIVIRVPLKHLKNFDHASVYGTSSDSKHSRIVRRSDTSLKKMVNNLNGLAGDGYSVEMEIGTPPQKLQFLIDTGSSNLAVACTPNPNLTKYFHSKNSSTYETSSLDGDIYVPYTEGEWVGDRATDVVRLSSASNLSVVANLACITSSKDFFIEEAAWQGILGLAYAELARPDSSVVPFFDLLATSNPGLKNIFSIQLCGSSFIHTRDIPLLEGSLIVGGYLNELAKSEIFYTPIYKEWYYEVVLTDLSVGYKSLGLPCKEYNFDKTIVDSGTTSIRLPSRVFQAVIKRIQMALKGTALNPEPSFYSGATMLCFEDMSIPFKAFPVVTFSLEDAMSANSSFHLHLSPQRYLRPEASMDVSVGVSQSCVKFGFSPSETGTVLGAVLMEAFYTIFDRANKRVGFAATSCPLPDPANQVVPISIQGPNTKIKGFNPSKVTESCFYQKPEAGGDTYMTVSYAMIAVSLLILVPFGLMCFFWVKKHWVQRSQHHLDDDSESKTVFSSYQE